MNKLPLNQVIQFYRKQAGLSQKDLAEKLYMSEKTISCYERGTRGLSTDILEKIATILELKVQAFFDEKKIEEDIRKSNIGEVAATIIKEYDNDLNIIYWVEIDVPETGEILEELTSGFFKTFEEAEKYIEGSIEPRYEILYYHEKDLTDIIDVEYVSCWDGGYAELTSKAKYDSVKNIVFDIEGVNVDSIRLDVLDREYIILPNGKELTVIREDEQDEYEKELENKEVVILAW